MSVKEEPSSIRWIDKNVTVVQLALWFMPLAICIVNYWNTSEVRNSQVAGMMQLHETRIKRLEEDQESFQRLMVNNVSDIKRDVAVIAEKLHSKAKEGQ